MNSCTQCAAENPPAALFCMSCGAALERRCSACGASAPAHARFCNVCGHSLDTGPDEERPGDAPAAPSARARADLDERRTATVLFADLSGYTAAAEKLDPEAVKRLLERSLARLGAEVERHGGHVDKFIGDNVMAIFGAPVAHGDDAKRAVLAGLGMQAAMSEINEPLALQHAVTFMLRIGINTGAVLAGNLGEGYTVIGDSVNVAARLQAAARPGTVTVGEGTYRATRSAIEYTALSEPLVLKGKSEPVPAWEARGAIVASATGHSPRVLAPLVGRGQELARLNELLDRVVRDGKPHLVTVLGEPGVGKSRLLKQFESEISGRATAPALRQGRCLPYGTSIVYWPLGEVLRSECAILDSDPPPAAREKLSGRLAELLGSGRDEDPERRAARVSLIGRVLGIGAERGGGAQPEGDPLRARELFFAAVREYVEGLARTQPVVLVWEDIHWADEGMLDLIEHLARWSRAPLLQVCLAREELLERRPGWGGVRRDATSVFLDPLDPEESRQLISALLGEADSANGVLAHVAARAEGNPLFAEEIVRHLGEAPDASAAELPTTVQGLLAARLDALAPFQRRLLAHAAVVGRRFPEDALVGVAEAEGGDLGEALQALRERDLVIVADSSASGEPQLAFKHALIRDVAYEMLPKATRAQKHFEVADFIETRADERVEEVVALLAEHYERAAQLASELSLAGAELEPYRVKALYYLESAGDAATALYSNADAFASYEAARQRVGADAEALARIAEKQGDVALRLGRVDAAIGVWESALEHHRESDEAELVAELHRKIGAALAHKGERRQAIEHHQHGINLIKDREPSLALVRLYEEAAWLYMQTGDNMLAIYASEKALRLAERLDEVRLASRAHGIFGRVFGRIGDTAKAHENLERAVHLARESDAHEAVIALLALGHHLESFDGAYEAAGEAYREALSLAQQIGDIPAEIEIHGALAKLSLHAARWSEAEASSGVSAELCEREGLIGKLCLPLAVRGRLRWREGDWAESERAYRSARELAERLGWSEVCFDALYGLATTLTDRGDLAGAETALTEALGVCERAGLVVQAIQAWTAAALLHASAARAAPAAEAARKATELAERVDYAAGRASALECRGLSGDGPSEPADLERARETWQDIGRPLEAARCELLLGERLLASDPAAARAAIERAQAAYAQLGVAHMASRAHRVAQAV
ncbi:MAG TPA: adenylate/guanylate cyclase domain-containing protein [Solirubrobacteraceae bacterium]|jgi:class 3 adenylate cyclase|nr:adenylate/guanylate cyclase domain-containing protein [Solirubrobacteraceae bacterium]